MTVTTAGVAGDDIIFDGAGTIDGAFSLDLVAGAAAVDIGGIVGTAASDANNLTSFTVTSAATADLDDVFTSLAQDVTATTINLNGTTYTSGTGGSTFTGATVLADNVTVTTAGVAGDDIIFDGAGTIDGAFSLDLVAGAAAVDIGGIVGTAASDANNLTSFTVTSAATADLDDVFTSGAVNLTADTIDMKGEIDAGGTVDINATNPFIIDNNLTSGDTTNITVTADDTPQNTFTLTGGVTLSSTSGALTITADDIDISGTITATNQIVTLRSNTAGDPIDLGTDANLANRLEFTDAELDSITASKLRIGDTTAGQITVSAASVGPDSVTANFSLLSDNGLDVSGGGTITFNGGLRLDVDQTVNLAGSNDVNSISANVADAGQTFTFADIDGLTVTTVDTLGGITTNNAGIILSAGGDDNTLTVSQAIDSGGNTIALTADKMALNAGVDAGGNLVTIQTTNAADAINLGSAVDTTGNTLELSDAELNQITAGTLRIGAADAGAITVSATGVGPDSVATAFTLLSDEGISGTGTITYAGGLRLDVDTAVALAGANDVDSLSANVTDGGETFTFADTDGLTITTVDTLSGVTTNNANITLTAGGNDNILTVSQAVASGDGNIALTADEMAFTAAVNAVAGTMTIDPENVSDTGDAINLGANNPTAANTLELSNTELALITSSSLTFNTTGTGAITVDGVTAGGTANTGDVVLNSTGSGDINFTGSNSSFTSAIEANANTGRIAFDAGRTLTAGGLIDLSSALPAVSDSITAAGNVTFDGDGGVTIDSTLSAAGLMTITDSGAVLINEAIYAAGGFTSTGTTFYNTGTLGSGTITTNGTDIQIIDHDGAVWIGGKLDSGNGGTIAGGNITITVTGANAIDLDALLTTQSGSGGSSSISGATTHGGFSDNVGAGTITVGGGLLDTTIGSDLSGFSTRTISAKRNVIINGKITTLGVNADLFLTASTDAGITDGKVIIDNSDPGGTPDLHGELIAGRHITMSGDEIELRSANLSTTAVGDVNFNAPTTIVGDSSVTTAPSGGNINFTDTVSMGTSNLSLNSGLASNITIDGAVTATQGTAGDGDLAVVQSQNVWFKNTVTVNSLDIQQAQGYVQLDGNIDADDNGNITINSNSWIWQKGMVTGGLNLDYDAGNDTIPGGTPADTNSIQIDGAIDVDGAVTIDSFGNTLISAGANITAGGVVTFAGDKTGPLSIGGNIVTENGDNITFNDDVTLGANVLFDTGGATTGDILFSENVDGGYLLTLVAGTGNIDFLRSIGATTPLDGLQINSGATVDFEDSLALDNNGLAITAGGGDV